MGSPHLKNYRGAMDLAEEMIHMADHQESTCEDDGMLLINAVIRDCGYKIRDAVERESRRFKNSEAAGPNGAMGSSAPDRTDEFEPGR